MKKVYSILLVLISLNINWVFSQDKIVVKDGKVFNCRITAISNDTIFFDFKFNDALRSTIAEISKIHSYTYKGMTTYTDTSLNQKLMVKPGVNTLKSFSDSIENLNKNFIVNNTGQVIFGNRLEYKQPFIGFPYFELDHKQINSDMVRFYKNEQGFYAKYWDSGFSMSPSFAQRIRKGRINLYEDIKIQHHYGMYNTGTGFVGGGTTVKFNNYYNIGFGDLKKANYQNLSIDLADNWESVLCLDKFKQKRNAQIIVGVIGGGLIAGGLLSFYNRTKDVDDSVDQTQSDFAGETAVMALGVGCIVATYIISFSKFEHLKDAVDAYNK
ncbi:MAG: hypothetical protein A2W97_04655 [Bacteroidetes bacterium GWE2_40_63]|jgi:hypothetical protein|nr:MAG: hypothetical protein A2W84_11515 [Bacteroidetes bacterium GWC2_40_13]OFX71313.1 MAG: hypothetical protein A2W96_14200 [Bacteroidetes bacterium GWD2_40_43]OFX91492.1 MAG: hypothetical protein A2W97_04655 [Bacteroidetes bacterium GWE2_40_63]OFY19561.1 MAG: hypothetical protein A2W88_02535 [Bacteroidetes bacterium GWF2_40_13]HAZ01813.1 hypothetical protein [Marinilabiliales bacterium]